MSPKAYVHHELPTRLRIYVPSKKGESTYFTQLQMKLTECDEIDGVEANSKTGSTVIYHHGEKQGISKFAEQNNLFTVYAKSDITWESHLSPAEKISERIQILDHSLVERSQGEVDLSTLTASGLVGLALIQVMQGRLLPPAWTLMSQAISAIRNGPKRAYR